jgi:hypothetical protein
MNIIRRDFTSPVQTLTLPLIPAMTYILQKAVGITKPEKEWYWWVAIGIACLIWFAVNFKMTKKDRAKP